MPGLELRQIVGVHARQAERGGEQAGGLRGQIGPGGVGAAHDLREAQRAAPCRRGRAPRPWCRRCSARRDGSRTTSSTSKGAASKRSATAWTSAGATNRNTAAGSTKRRISQGQAMRSIFGRARVTQTVRPRPSRAGSLAARNERQAGLRPGLEAARQRLGRHALVPEPGGDALAQLLSALADDDRGAARELRRPVRRRGVARAARRRGSAGDRRRNPRPCARR